MADAQITTIALAQEPELPLIIEKRAAQLVADWLQKYNSEITRLSAADQEKFDRIKRESDRPLPTTFTIPKDRTEEADGDEWDRHVLSDTSGKFKARFGNTETHVLREELNHGALAWIAIRRAAGPTPSRFRGNARTASTGFALTSSLFTASRDSFVCRSSTRTVHFSRMLSRS